MYIKKINRVFVNHKGYNALVELISYFKGLNNEDHIKLISEILINHNNNMIPVENVLEDYRDALLLNIIQNSKYSNPIETDYALLLRKNKTLTKEQMNYLIFNLQSENLISIKYNGYNAEWIEKNLFNKIDLKEDEIRRIFELIKSNSNEEINLIKINDIDDQLKNIKDYKFINATQDAFHDASISALSMLIISECCDAILDIISKFEPLRIMMTDNGEKHLNRSMMIKRIDEINNTTDKMILLEESVSKFNERMIEITTLILAAFSIIGFNIYTINNSISIINIILLNMSLAFLLSLVYMLVDWSLNLLKYEKIKRKMPYLRKHEILTLVTLAILLVTIGIFSKNGYLKINESDQKPNLNIEINSETENKNY